MKFKDWFLSEIVHVSLPKHIRVNGILADTIDFRFEDWKKGYNPEKNRSGYMPEVNPAQFIRNNFSAPLNDNRWLNVDLDSGPEVSYRPIFTPIPRFWWDFAAAYHGQQIVKPPEWPRNNMERGVLVTTEPPRIVRKKGEPT